MVVGSLSLVSGSTDVPLLEMTIDAALRRAATQFAERPALTSLAQDKTFTYTELNAAADEVARALMGLGVETGARVAIWSANRWEWLVAHHGIIRAGAIVVPVNPAFRAEETRYILDDAGVEVVISARTFRGFSFADTLADITGRLPQLRHIILFETAPAPQGMTNWSDFLAAGAAVSSHDVQARAAAVSFDMPAHVQYTSGTTGRPKGALLTHHGILNNGYFVGLRQRLTERDSICLPVPFFHCFGNVLGALAALLHGSEIVLPGESFDPLETLRAVESRQCTSLYGVPMMFIAMLARPELSSILKSRSLRTGAIGAAPCPLPTMMQIMERMNMEQITVVYGMTETSPISFQSHPDDSPDVRVSTVGAIQPHLEGKVIDALGATVERGRPGELCVRGYSVMKGYWNRPEATREAVDAEGWMHTGDLAVMRDDGYVQIVGRIKDTIIRGGENIYPREVEEFLLTLPDINEAYVFGLPDPSYGEEVCAWIRLKPGSEVLARQITDMCKGRIATYKIPRFIRIVDEFPATASGKVQKFRMRELEVESHAQRNLM